VRLRHRRTSAADRATIAADGKTNSPEIEKYVIESGIILIKIWLEVGQEEQERRFRARMGDPLRQWKLSPLRRQTTRAPELHLAYPWAIPFKRIHRPKVTLPKRASKRKYDDAAALTGRHFAREQY
jgi:hypothetical protein